MLNGFAMYKVRRTLLVVLLLSQVIIIDLHNGDSGAAFRIYFDPFSSVVLKVFFVKYWTNFFQVPHGIQAVLFS